MGYKFFTNSEKSWEAMYKAIESANTSIYLEMYIFENSLGRFNFFELLKQKAEQGLRVKILLDCFGSMDLSNNQIIELKKSGIEIFFLSYLLSRAHRKVLIIDESRAFLWGVNFHKTSRLWDDLVVSVQGILVKSAVKSFIKSYINAGGQDAELLNQKNNKISLERVNAWIIDQYPFKKLFTLQKIYKNRIDKARERIILITPYFMPNRWLAAILHQAVLRGVSVEIILPTTTDHFIIDRVNYFYMYRFAKLGIKFYLEPTMNHAKALIIDRNEGMVGSQNLDFLSFDFNSEVGVFFRDAEVVWELINIAQQWKSKSIVFDYHTYKPSWFDYILSPVIKILSKIFKIWLPG